MQEVQSTTTDFRVFPSLPLLNFLGLLVPAVQSGAVDMFKTLKSHYAGNLKEVPVWEEVCLFLSFFLLFFLSFFLVGVLYLATMLTD